MPFPSNLAYEQELRLLAALLINAAVLASSWRFAVRRLGGDFITHAVDALLIYFLVQYLVIGALGLGGVLAPATIAGGALLSSALLWTLAQPRRKNLDPAPKLLLQDRRWIWTCFLFLLGFVGAVMFYYRLTVPLANDPMTYHLPAAAQWLRTGRLGLFETWFFNPANTYSPLAGSMFTLWLMAPFRSDVAARFVEVGPLLLIFWLVLDLSRRLGASIAVAAIVALAAVLSRPFISHVNLAKDDLFVAAFFLACVYALVAKHQQSLFWASIRAGCAIGLMLATKYTALMALPLLLLLIDAPRRVGWRWRHVAISLLIAFVLAGPWYLRNLSLTDNPLFPIDVSIGGWRIFDGMMSVIRSERLEGLTGWWEVLTQGYYPMPVIGMIALILGWIAAWSRARELKTNALLRLVLIGAPAGIAVFLLTSPYAEMRFIYPSLLLLFVAFAAATRLLARWDWLAAVLLLVIAIATSFASDYQGLILRFTITAALVTGIVTGLAWQVRRWPRIYRLTAAGVVVVAAVGFALLSWNGYISAYRVAPEQNWSHPNGRYLGVAGAWDFVRNEIPPRETVAYTNLYLVYPLMGFSFDRRLVYAATRPGVEQLHDLPKFPGPVSGEQIQQSIEVAMWRDADRDVWLANLRRSGASYLIIGTESIVNPGTPATPPELRFVRSMPEAFHPVFRDASAIVFRINAVPAAN